MTFNLHQAIDDVIDSHDSHDNPDPRGLVGPVLASIPEDSYADVVRLLLPALIATTINNRRRAVIRDTDREPDTSTPNPRLGVDRMLLPENRGKWQRLVDQRLFVGVWKRLGDCTVDDLFRAADVNYSEAEANRVEGEKKERAAKILEEHEAGTVDDLPEDARDEFMGALNGGGSR